MSAPTAAQQRLAARKARILSTGEDRLKVAIGVQAHVPRVDVDAAPAKPTSAGVDAMDALLDEAAAETFGNSIRASHPSADASLARRAHSIATAGAEGTLSSTASQQAAAPPSVAAPAPAAAAAPPVSLLVKARQDRWHRTMRAVMQAMRAGLPLLLGVLAALYCCAVCGASFAHTSVTLHEASEVEEERLRLAAMLDDADAAPRVQSMHVPFHVDYAACERGFTSSVCAACLLLTVKLPLCGTLMLAGMLASLPWTELSRAGMNPLQLLPVLPKLYSAMRTVSRDAATTAFGFITAALLYAAWASGRV